MSKADDVPLYVIMKKLGDSDWFPSGGSLTETAAIKDAKQQAETWASGCYDRFFLHGRQSKHCYWVTCHRADPNSPEVTLKIISCKFINSSPLEVLAQQAE